MSGLRIAEDLGAGFFGRKKDPSPLDSGRWSAWREVRACHEGEEDFWDFSMGLLPRDVEAWAPSDHALVDRACEVFLGGEGAVKKGVFFGLAVALATRDGESAKEAIDELFGRVELKEDTLKNLWLGLDFLFWPDGTPEPDAAQDEDDF